MSLLSRLFGGSDGDDLDRVRAETRRLQSQASDPASSVWVSANAGTGKTHVLTMRVLRLLLAGTPPERILALTYTKAAAAEMSKRVFDRLAEWVTADEHKLAGTLEELTGRSPSADELRLARRLFAVAIETPGGLKVQTIHAFCERLLQRFSLEADVPPGFEILDDHDKAELLSEAMDEMLLAATAPGNAQSALARALACAVGFATETSFEELLAEALGEREWLERAGGAAAPDADLGEAEALYREGLGVREGRTSEAIDAAIAELISAQDLARIKAVLESGGKSDQDLAALAGEAMRARSPAQRFEAYCELFLTQAREPRKKLMTKALIDDHAQLHGLFSRAQDGFARLAEERAALQVYEASLALTRLAGFVMDRYRHLKAQRAALDFEDLVAKSAHLLERSDAVEWVLYKLDNGIDHILVDEAQDTAPLQWHVVRALAQEFFSGEGAQREGVRTLFAVGDEKQSIYGFQGAAPHMFRNTGDRFQLAADAAGLAWRKVPLSLSFRSTAPLLKAVDRIFADPARTPGVGGAAVVHMAHRAGHAGHVEVWPVELPDEPADESKPWEPLASPAAKKPAARLAQRIADTIAGWLATGERLHSEGRPIRAGDILILVRKRVPFAPVMVSALKARGIAVAGADRLLLTEQIAVMDLVALGQVMVLPEDDLSLAALLKSPLLGLDDDDLIAIAPKREGSLWQALHKVAAAGASRLAEAVEKLRRWRQAARERPPYEFFAGLLDAEGQRKRMLARLGPDAADAIDEFLNLALAYGQHAPPTLQGFLISLSDVRHEIKRDMEQGRDEVRVMTVHGAKGLEAPIVFLPDTCHAGSGRPPGTLIEMAGGERDGEAAPFLWPVKGTSKVPAVVAARQALRVAEAEERNRLLYVALTRPRDRLYVAGFQGVQAPAADCWYNLIAQGLDGLAEKVTGRDGRTLLILDSPQSAKAAEPRLERAQAPAAEPLPAWADRPAPAEPLLSLPLSPSRLAPLEHEATETGRREPAAPKPRRPREPVILPPAVLADEARFLRGTLTHALLEHLPSLGVDQQEAAARAFLAGQAPKLPAAVREGIVAETIAILRDQTFAPLFGPQSRAEVALAAEIPRPAGKKGPALSLSGKIDRLVKTDEAVLIVDFKTNRPPPEDADDVADAYLLQLSAYRLAVQSIFPESPIRCAILWTDGPRIMEIKAAVLDAYEARLWELDPVVLDA
ncbi:MAG: double-strand break repair helicase AddA [Hyphomicrobiaceae bacterium]|nr:double-strand break repair helicase AddA [Hyphomicrobiaceae bacterium]